MAGDATNATVWPDADVYWSPDTNATIPASVDAAFSAAWDLVGLLDGEAGIVQSREEEVNDLYAWGGIIVRTTRRNFKQSVTFTALEDNDTTHDLIWPGSSLGTLVVPRPIRGRIAFEMREGDRTHRLISIYQAEVAVNGDITDSESDLTRYELIATIYPDPSTSPAQLFKEQKSDNYGGS